jgi:hypothetical protein
MSEVHMPNVSTHLPSAQTHQIPQELLSEQWFSFVQYLIGGMQSAYREAQKRDPDLNQKVMAAKLTKKPSFISRCLSGQTNMTIRTIHDMARAMDCRLEVVWRPLSSLQPTNRRPEEDQIRAVAAGTSSTAAHFLQANTAASANVARR